MRRLRSGYVVLGGMGALALTLTSCGSDEPDKRCVDRVTREILPTYKCHDGTSRDYDRDYDSDYDSGGGSSGGAGYYYGGSVRDGRAEDGSFDRSAVERGGFGSSGSGGG
ncbi:hypothetical protein ACFPM3_29405 [Streptomyces coeruleoprunus]|uniref:Lipoprotein n=1 Tax=Streptomyces coeruleoprunus TaxID=285563 RepID=A0ABV9XPX4_9ACTN